MMKSKNQIMFDKFKKSYILEKANEMAQNYEFIKGFTLKKMAEYMNLLSIFWKKNQISINNIINNKNNKFSKNLIFIIEIPKLIKIYDKEAEIDYVFLRENFSKIEKNEKITELQNNIKKLEQKLEPINDSSFNFSDLYEFGDLILNFLTNENIRIEICRYLLESKIKKNKLEETLNKWIIQEQISTTIWKNNQTKQV